MQAKSPLAKVIITLLLIAGSVFFTFPLIWMVSTSVKPISQTTETPPPLFPRTEYMEATDGRKYLAVYYTNPVVEPGKQPAEVLVPLLRREGDRCEIERSAEGALRERAWVDTSTIRVPPVWRWENYWKAVTYRADLLGYVPFLRYARNTLYIAILSVIGTVLSNALVAYGFARINWPGRDIFFALTIATMMIPSAVLQVPVYVLFKSLGWIGSPKPLWVPAFFGSAFNIFLLRQFLMSVPFELSDAAKIDGCSEFRTFRDVVLPLIKPALAVVALFNFMHVWNDFLGPLLYLTDQKTYTLAYGLQAYQSQHGGTQWPLLMAAATIVVLPVILVFFFTQRTFIQGITVTGMKN